MKIFNIIEYIVDSFMAFFYKRKMISCGNKVRIKPSTSVFFGLENLKIGNHVSIPRYSHIFCTDANLTIGNKVIFGPNPTIVTGDHRIDVIGEYIIDSKDKLVENDKEVHIEDDIWIGANVTILKGVRIGRGSVIAAGSVVNKSCPPYSIIGGVPAKVLKFRFTIDQILKHEKTLYDTSNRLQRRELMEMRKIYE